jgi:hypothetical protein
VLETTTRPVPDRAATPRGRAWRALLLAGGCAVGITWWGAGPASAHEPADGDAPASAEAAGLTNVDLVADAEACPGGLAMVAPDGTTSCTHGPDPAPEGVDVRQERELPEAQSAAAADLVCEGDGTSGYRIQAIYARPADRADRSASVVPAIPGWAADADAAFADSAATMGGTRHLRYVMNPDCTLDVDVVTLSAAAGGSFQIMIDELQDLGYTRSDRKYLVWMDEVGSYCGIAQMYPDDRSSQSNWNNGGIAMFARVDQACWGHGGSSSSTEAHELVHTLGGVQSTAPHATGNGHCTDEYDVMCYVDGQGVSMQYLCPSSQAGLLDCGHDDYFHLAPTAGSYLATHWNVANNRFLITTASNGGGGVPSAPPAAPTGVTATPDTASGGTWSVTVRWTASAGPGVTGYRVTSSSGAIASVGATATSATLAGIAPGAATFSVVATSAAGDSGAATSGPTTMPLISAGYWLVGADGGVFSFGTAPFLGSTGNITLNRPIVGLAAHPSGNGYWFVAEDGGIFAYGSAAFYGSTGDRAISGTITAMAAHPSGGGYWLLSSTGQVYAFGAAADLGSGTGTSARWVGIAPNGAGTGYWLVAADGTVAARGTAQSFGDMSATPLSRPIVGLAVHPSGNGYWLVGSDGGIFSFGTAPFYGSTGAITLNQPIVGMTSSPSGNGYLFVARDGGIFAYGDAAFMGSTGAMRLNSPIIALATR